MKRLLILSFDIHRAGEPTVSYGLGCIVSSIKARLPEWQVETHNLDSAFLSLESLSSDVRRQAGSLNYSEYDAIAISAYVWNEFCINPLISMIKDFGFAGRIIVGGYQITYAQKDQLNKTYPQADIFVSGAGEEGIIEALSRDDLEMGIVINSTPDFECLPSPYLDGTIPVDSQVYKVRMETQRGCPYTCSFCAHRDLFTEKGGKSVNQLGKERYAKELEYFRGKGIQRISILDPIFNIKMKSSLDFFDRVVELGMQATEFSLQTRLEFLARNNQRPFLDAASTINVQLEFGLQTVIEEESKIIDRKNDIEKVSKALDLVNERGIHYEVSLIYGLPNQTLDSFQRSIDFLLRKGCKSLVAYPLMLLRGTELFDQKDQWGMVERAMGDYHIPTVISSNSFSESDWLKMRDIAESLGDNGRVAA